MNSFTSIYQRASEATLISLTDRPHKLVQEAQEALIDELANRGMENELQKVRHELQIAEMLSSKTGLDEFMALRKNEGFDQVQIMMELKERGINMFEVQNSKGDQEEVLYNRLVDLQQAKGKNQLTEEKLKERYDLSNDELSEIKMRAVRRGKTNVVLGIILILLGSIGFIFSLVIERPRLLILATVFLGISLVIKGTKLQRVE